MADLDKFYTKREVAQRLFEGKFEGNPRLDNALVVEPSAGDGAILEFLPRKRTIALDLEPAAKGIKQANFFDFEMYRLVTEPPFPKEPKTKRDRYVIVAGNPPFGQNASLAVKFFNHASTFADEIRFIVPRSFRKDSVQRRLCDFFHLRHDEDLPKNSFLKDGQPYDVPCCFQIWVRAAKHRRKRPAPVAVPGVQFVKDPSQANLAIRRVGGRAGQVVPLCNDKGAYASASSTYYLNIQFARVHQKLKSFEGSLCPVSRNNTAGVRSVSKPELLDALARLVSR